MYKTTGTALTIFAFLAVSKAILNGTFNRNDIITDVLIVPNCNDYSPWFKQQTVVAWY